MTGQLLLNGQPAVSQVRYAAGFMARGRGWLGYEYTPIQGIWLPATRSVHTCGMRIALDLIWLDQNGYCCHTDRAVSAWCVRYHAQASAVIELRCGLIKNVKGEHFSWSK